MEKISNLFVTKPIVKIDNEGNLINTRLEDICNNYPSITLNERQVYDYEMIQNGGFHPLTGFMKKDEYDSCINNMSLPDGSIWPMPVTLHISEKWLMDNIINKDLVEKNKHQLEDVIVPKKFKKYLKSTYTVLKNETGLPLALMKNESIFKMDLHSEAKHVFNSIGDDGQVDTNHPYVQILSNYQTAGLIYCIGGKLINTKEVPHYDFMDLRRSPKLVKETMEKMGWDREKFNIIGFQTRNPMHRSHYQLTKKALAMATELNGKPSKLLLHPVVGITQNCDIDYHTRVKCYRELVKKYDDNEALLSLLPLSMRMAGPREAVWHAIIRKNYGVTHFVVGRDHAGPSYTRSNGKKFYGPYDAQDLLLKNSGRIGITVITSQMIVFTIDRSKVYQQYSTLYQKPLDQITEGDIKNLDFMCQINETDGQFKSMDCLDNGKELYFEISGTQQRKLLRENKPIPSWFSYPEIIAILRKEFKKDKGIVFYLIGLSGAGKSTIANNLIAVLKELTFKTISYLDGDIVRQNLSKGLGFSKEDRSTNVRRIGYVASEIAKHGGICIVANIAPYADDRLYNKNLIETNGGHYVEIFVDTAIDECEKRDVKGLYKLAKEDKIKLTGVNDPFEKPISSDIIVNGNDSMENILNKINKYIKEHDLFG